jgi:hypothetical protein
MSMHGNKVTIISEAKSAFCYCNQRQLYMGHKNKDQAASPLVKHLKTSTSMDAVNW